MKYHLFLNNSDEHISDERTTLVVATCSTQATREALTVADPLPHVTGVAGWVDISAPNLVDLIDDLSRGRGGSKLTDLRVELNSQDIPNVPIQRGLSIIGEAGLGILFGTELTDPDTIEYLSSIGAHPLPDL